LNRWLGSVGAALLLAVSAGAQDFSADIANLSARSNTFHTRIFATKDKLRFQQEVKSGRVDSIMIVNLAKRTSVVLIPQQKQYIESDRPQIPGQGVMFFQAKDVEDACGEWESLIRIEIPDSDAPTRRPVPKYKCQKIGHETVNGRDTVKYDDTTDKGETSLIWLDVKLHFPIKWKNAVSTGELQNIKEEPQPAELFAIPPAYTKRKLTYPAQSK
jgi:hypothetical protein